MMSGVTVEIARRRELQDGIGRFRRMVEIRETEDRIRELFATGLVAGSTHTCQGQEAVSVGIASVLEETDMVCCTYRGHGHAMALGMTAFSVVAEILGRTGGCVGGVGGSMHLCDRSIGLMPTMAIVGAGIPIAAGAGLAAQLDGSDRVAAAIFGDGTANIGAFHEGLNIAAVWKLPVVFICENNLYGEYSRIDDTTAVTDIWRRGAAYLWPAPPVAVPPGAALAAALATAAARARAGEGPTLLEMKTYRYAGHSRSDPATYRPEGELDRWLERDPIALARQKLIEAGTSSSELDAETSKVREHVVGEIERAKESPEPDLDAMFAHVYADPVE